MKKRIVPAIALTCIITIIIASASTSGWRDRTAKPILDSCAVVQTGLNDTLTNGMSDIPELQGMERSITGFLKKWEIRGASLAIMRNDSLVYAKGFGWADMEDSIRMEPGNILRMASVSKLITATGIMYLKERNLLSLEDTVFGPGGILDDSLFTSSIRDRRIFGITVEQLLRHKGGFTTGHGDPMFSSQDMIRQFRLDEAPDSRTLVRCELTRWLGFSPGSSQQYSNFGYLLLSMIIEKVSGMPYEKFIQENILGPAGCRDMHIARNYYEERYPNEVKYYMQAGSVPCEEYNLSGRMVEKCYGGSDITGLSGAGAWVGSPAELCRFVASIDGRPEIPDIISGESVAEMTGYFDPQTFSLGWNDTKPDGEWTRTGTLSGTSALVKCYPDGECWIMITNTGTYRGPYFSKYVSTLFRKCREAYSRYLPDRDLFLTAGHTRSQSSPSGS